MWQEALPWNWTSLWLATNDFTKAMLLLLLVMLLHVSMLFLERVWKFRSASKICPLDSATLLDKAFQGGAFARLVAIGYDTFQSTLPFLSKRQATQFAQGAIERCRLLLHAEMKTGISAVATIAALSPLVGLAGTVFGLLDGLRGGSNTPTGWMVYYANVAALSLLPTALGILVGVLAIWFYNHLLRKAEIFEVQSARASATIGKYLSAQIADRKPDDAVAGIEIALFKNASGSEAHFDRYRVLFGSVWLVCLYVFGTIAWACLSRLKYG